jgi:hypothetical protein
MTVDEMARELYRGVDGLSVCADAARAAGMEVFCAWKGMLEHDPGRVKAGAMTREDADRKARNMEVASGIVLAVANALSRRAHGTALELPADAPGRMGAREMINGRAGE